MNAAAHTGVEETAAQRRRPSFSRLTKTYLACVIGFGSLSVFDAVVQWNTLDPVRFWAYLSIAIIASLLKVRLPGIHGTLSVNFFFFLVAIRPNTVAGQKPGECVEVSVQSDGDFNRASSCRQGLSALPRHRLEL
jgi:hypothetical protein